MSREHSKRLEAIFECLRGRYPSITTIEDGLTRAAVEIDGYLEALNKIACWNEGDKVTGSFDEPASAQEAREAIFRHLPCELKTSALPTKGEKK